MSPNEPDLSPAPGTDTTGHPPDPAADLRRVLVRVAWRDRPTVHLHYDEHHDILTATILRLPPVRDRHAHDHLLVRLDGDEDLALPTEVRLQAFIAKQRSDAAVLARELLGETAWRRAVKLTVDGRCAAEVKLEAPERDELFAIWAGFARLVRVVGIQVQPGLLRGVLVDDRGEAINEKELWLDEMSPDSVAAGIADLATCLWRPDERRDCHRVVGVQIGGPVNHEDGVVHHYSKGDLGSNIRWKDVKLGELVKGRIGSRVQVFNDVASLAVFERWFGLGRQVRRYGLILVSEGVGGALVIDGVLDEESPMELGNIVIHPEGRKCHCGSRGCVEATAGVWAIVERVAEEVGHPVADLGAAAKLADADDEHLAKMVRQVFRTAGEDLAVGIGSVQALLRPTAWTVYLPPELSETGVAGREFWSGIEQFGTWVSFEEYRKCDLHRRTTTGVEGPLGAALAALERFGLSSTAAAHRTDHPGRIVGRRF